MDRLIQPHGSMRAKIAALKTGESFSRAERIDFDSATKETLADTMQAMRNAVTPSANRASNETGNQYVVETGKWITRSGDVMLAVVVTRLD